MTLQTLFEQIKDLFPGAQYANVLADINNVQKLFVERTRVLEGKLIKEIASVPGSKGDVPLVGSSEVLTWTPHGYSYALPSDIYQVSSVVLYGDNDAVLTNILSVNLENRYLYFTDKNQKVFNVWPAAVKKFCIYYAKYPTVFTVDTSATTELEVPSSLHEGILAKVLAKWYAKEAAGAATPELKIAYFQLIKYYEGLWNEFIKDGKRYANEQGSYGNYTVKQYEF